VPLAWNVAHSASAACHIGPQSLALPLSACHVTPRKQSRIEASPLCGEVPRPKIQPSPLCGEVFYCDAWAKLRFWALWAGVTRTAFTAMLECQDDARSVWHSANLLSMSWRLCDVAARPPCPSRSKPTALLLFMPKCLGIKCGLGVFVVACHRLVLLATVVRSERK
jgi:hypothetical protein